MKFDLKALKLPKINVSKKLMTAIALVGCAVLLVVGSVLGTVALLTSKAEVVNSFTYGQVYLYMDETRIAADGVNPVQPAERTTANSYKLLPSYTYVKDPQIRLDAQSEPSYLFVHVNHQLASVEATEGTVDESKTYHTIENQMLALGWVKLTGNDELTGYDKINGDSNNAVYVYCGLNSEGNPNSVPLLMQGKNSTSKVGVVYDEESPISVFNEFKVNKDASEAVLKTLATSKITVTAYGVQAAGYLTNTNTSSMEKAVSAFKDAFGAEVPDNNGNTVTTNP